MRFSEKLIQLRKDKDWTQAIAARNIAIQQSYLSKLENGRYIPSEEVIEKLCNAYDVSRTELMIPNTEHQSRTKYWVLAMLLGLVFALMGYLSLIFPQTYYTYKTTAIDVVDPSVLSLNYHMTDQYQGERYIEKFSSNTYEYVLIAERDILRKENRWLIAFGLLLIITSAGYLVISRYFASQVVSRDI